MRFVEARTAKKRGGRGRASMELDCVSINEGERERRGIGQVRVWKTTKER